MMDRTEFKKTIGSFLRGKGFAQYRDSWTMSMGDVTIVFSTRKSDYSNVYYVIYGFLVPCEGRAIEHPKTTNCDVTLHVPFAFPGGVRYSFDMDTGTADILQAGLEAEFARIIEPVRAAGLRYLYRLQPALVKATTRPALQYLGLV